MGKKRDVSIFDAIDELETQDRRADGKRHKQHHADQQRAQQVYQQTQIYQHLVESRILLQRAIVVNTKDITAAKATSSSSSSESSPSVSSKTKFRDTCNELLEQLLLARNQLSGVGNAQDKKNFYKNIILSAESSSQLSKMLQEEHEQHREQWRRILNQRHKSLRLHSGVTSAKSSQFRVMDASFWEQVEATVEYEKLRTNNNNNNNNTATLLDDSKVYQQLLKDFVASHAQQTGTEAAAAAAERLRLAQRKSNKEKNKLVDRRASKGRKLRYKEIPKLVNFTFPLSRPSTTSNLQQDEYFQSLFGGAAAVAIQGQTK